MKINVQLYGVLTKKFPDYQSSNGIDIELPDKDVFSGKEVFSLMLPKNLNIGFKANCCKNCDECDKHNCPHDGWVEIKKGQLLKGRIDSKAVGAMKGKLLNKHYFDK